LLRRVFRHLPKKCYGKWKVERHRRVNKWLRHHPEAKAYYDAAVEALKTNPYVGEPLHGRCRGLYKLRKGQLRLVYRLIPEECTILIEAVGYRENIYEELGC
jgi:mRNA-degrading endonuclease RelE of RelBE toxin-antitoxin system